MSTTSTDRTYFGDGTGSDGRAITDTDLNAISENGARRAWEVPGYAEILAFDQIDQTADYDYGAVFSGSYSTARLSGVFTVGGGLRPYASGALVTSIGAGMLGIWRQSGAQTAPAQNGVPNMMWVHVGASETVVHDDCAAGYKRWDVVQCDVEEVNAATVQRHWEDATTGAKTSQAVVPAKKMTVTFSVKKGAAASGGTETVPSPDPGKHVLYAVHIDGDEGGADVAGIEEQRDLTIPVGRLKKVLQPADAATFNPSAWEFNGYGALRAVTGATRTIHFFPPCSGNREARILGVRIAYLLSAAAGVYLHRITHDSIAAVSEIQDISNYLSLDGAAHTTFLRMRGAPSSDQLGPIWAGGSRVKEEVASSTGLMLTIAGGATSGTEIVYSVEWYYVDG